jgi:hypothetical protein
MVWTIKSIDYTTVPSREGERTYDSEAAFESAVRATLADIRTKVVSATLPDGSILDEAELRRRYGSR